MGAALISSTLLAACLAAPGSSPQPSPTVTPFFPKFTFRSPEFVTVGETITLAAETNLGPVEYSLDPADTDRARLEGDRLTGLAPGPVLVTASAASTKRRSLLAVVSNDPDFEQLVLDGNLKVPWGDGALLLPSATEIAEFPFDTKIPEAALGARSVLLLPYGMGSIRAVGVQLERSADAATLSMVVPRREAPGYIVIDDGPTNLERILLEPGLASFSVEIFSRTARWEATESVIAALSPPFPDRVSSALPAAQITASYSPKPMVFGSPFTISGRVLGPPSRIPLELQLGIWGGILGDPTSRQVDLARVQVNDRRFSYTWTLPPDVSDGGAPFPIVAEMPVGPGKHGYSLNLTAPGIGGWGDQILWAL